MRFPYVTALQLLSKMSFGTELWVNLSLIKDQTKVVEAYTEAGDFYVDKVNDFLKGVVLAESEYAKALIKASKPIRDEISRKHQDKSKLWKTLLDATHHVSLQCVLSEVESIASSHLALAKLLEDDIRQSLKAKRKQLFQQNQKVIIKLTLESRRN